MPKVFANKKTSMNLLRDGDEFNGVLRISGETCIVMANFEKG